MRVVLKLTLVLGALYLRDPMAVLFTLLLAPLLVVLFGLAFGNAPDPLWGGMGHLDANLPAYTAWVFGIAGLFSVPIGIATMRDSGTLRRFRATPLRPLHFIVADALVYFVTTMSGIALLLLVGMLAFGARPQGSLASVAAAAGLGTLAFLAIGYAIASVVPTARVALVVGNALVFPMIFFSGAAAPLEVMPERVQAAARFFPLKHVVDLMRGLWLGDAWRDHAAAIGVLAALVIVGVGVAAWRFRWE